MGIAAAMAFIAGALALVASLMEYLGRSAQPPDTRDSRSLIYAMCGVTFISAGFVYLFIG